MVQGEGSCEQIYSVQEEEENEFSHIHQMIYRFWWHHIFGGIIYSGLALLFVAVRSTWQLQETTRMRC
jgi:hypothetical protein